MAGQNHAPVVCLASHPSRYVLSFLSVCGFVTTLGGGVCGCAAPPWEVGLTFGVVGDIHIRVCISLPVTKGCLLLPPRFTLRG
jgi:hypothetical protein